MEEPKILSKDSSKTRQMRSRDEAPLRVFVDPSERCPVPISTNYLSREKLEKVFAKEGIKIVDRVEIASLQISNFEAWTSNLQSLPREQVILVEGEPPQPDHVYPAYGRRGFGAILTPANGVVFSSNHLAFFPGQFPRPDSIARKPRFIQLATYRPSQGNDPEDCNFMVGTINGEIPYRHRVLCYLRTQVGLAIKKSVPQLIDLFGRGWPESAGVLENSRHLDNEGGYSSWADRKIDLLEPYGFNLCWENMEIPGYVSEKFWDCLTGCVLPLYWGPPAFHEALPEDSIIDCRRYFRNDGTYDVQEMVYSALHLSEEEYIRRMYLLYDWAEELPPDGQELAFIDVATRLCDQLWALFRSVETRRQERGLAAIQDVSVNS